MSGAVPVVIIIEARRGAGSIDFNYSGLSEMGKKKRVSFEKPKEINKNITTENGNDKTDERNQLEILAIVESLISIVSNSNELAVCSSSIEEQNVANEDDVKIISEEKEIIHESKINDCEQLQSGDVPDLTLKRSTDNVFQVDVKNVAETSSSSTINYLGNRKFAEITVETYSNKSSLDEENLRKDDKQSGLAEIEDLEKMAFFSGNPFLEKTSGVLHFYKRSEKIDDAIMDCSMLCMIGIPSLINCPELLRFISPCFELIHFMKIVRYSAPNQYMVIIKFKTTDGAMKFYREYNGIPFNEIEPEKCSLLFVERIDSVDEGEGVLLDSFTELPSCAVCLERLDDKVLTVLCNHSFHTICLEKWADTTCPVCRYTPTPEVIPNQKCSECGKSTDLWMCLICGNIGCGRYSQGHAKTHFISTSHIYALQIGSNHVWDYAGDAYVHRLVQNMNDLKIVEIQRNERDDNTNMKISKDEKLEDIQLEYTYMLTSQLQQQREYFEQKLIESNNAYSELEARSRSDVEKLQCIIEEKTGKYEEFKKAFNCSQVARAEALRKLDLSRQKSTEATKQLNEEKAMVALLRSNQEMLKLKIDKLEKESGEMEHKFVEQVNDLNEQVRDLMLHFESQEKIQAIAKDEGVTEEDLMSGSMDIKINEKETKDTGKRRTRGRKRFS